MSDAPVLSVITPTWNRRGVILDAIESARAQTVANYEHIIVDDGSTDGTYDLLIEQYADDPRVRVFRQSNRGVSAARNRAIDEVRAPWVGLLDSDDVWQPDFIESQLAFADAHPDADVVVGDCRYEGDHGHPYGTTMERPEWIAPDSLENLCVGAWIQPSSVMFRTEALRTVRFDESLRQAEDVDLLFQLLIAGFTIRENPHVVAAYRADVAAGDAERATADTDENRVAVHEIRHRYADHCEACRQDALGLTRRRAKYLMGQGRWKEARPYLWRWWLRKPDSLTALRGALRSLFAWR